MLSEIQVGGHQHIASGSQTRWRGGATGHGMVAQAYGRHTDGVLRGQVYWGSNAFGTAVTTQAGLSATTPALTLYNPVGSGVYLSLLSVQVNFTADPAAATDLCLAYNAKNATAPASTTDGTMVNALLGNANAPKGRCYRVATLAAAPVAFMMLGLGQVDTGHVGQVQGHWDIGGSVGLEEGVAISIQARTAVAIVASFCWEEISK